MKRSAAISFNRPKIKHARLTDFFKTLSSDSNEVNIESATDELNNFTSIRLPSENTENCSVHPQTFSNPARSPSRKNENHNDSTSENMNKSSSTGLELKKYEIGNFKPRGKQRQFQDAWLKELPWIDYNKNSEIAKCAICTKYPNIIDQSSKFVCGFKAPFKLETFKKHCSSQQHLKCVAALKAETDPSNTALAKCVRKIDEKMFNHLKIVFNAAYYLAKNNRPFTDIKDILILISNCGIEVLEEYSNNNSCKEIVAHIAHVIEEDLLLELKQSRFLSILLDGSTDKSDEEQLVVYVRYVKNNMIKECFLGIIPLENGTSDSYLHALKQMLQKKDLGMLLEPTSPLIGIGTDGAAAMVGKENGLTSKLRSLTGLQHLISIHCVAHRLNLAVLNSITHTKYLSKVDSVLKNLYKFYQNSPKRLKQLKKVSDTLETEILKFQYLHNVRWVASKVNSLTALVRNYTSVVLHLEELSNSSGEESATAKGLLKDLKTYRFVIFVHFLLDFLKIFNSLSLLFQKSNQFLPSINMHVQKALLKLEELKNKCGDMENSVVSNTTLNGKFKEIQLTNIGNRDFETDKKNILDEGIKFLKKRFLNNSTSIIEAISVFDTFQWPDGKELFKYGDNKIETLGLHFKKFLNMEEKSEEEFREALSTEWLDIKAVGKNFTIEQFLEKTQTMQDRFPYFNKLVEIIAVTPVSTVSCERGFSHMNVIKNKLRSRLEISTLHNLLMINLNGTELKNFNPDRAVNHWYFKTKGVRHVNGHKVNM